MNNETKHVMKTQVLELHGKFLVPPPKRKTFNNPFFKSILEWAPINYLGLIKYFQDQPNPLKYPSGTQQAI